MNKDLHDTDDFFKKAYQQFQDEPSADVWEKISAGLNKKEDGSNRRKFIWWRRVSIVLSLLLAGYVLFDSDIFRTGLSRKNDHGITGKSNTVKPPAKNNEINKEEPGNEGKGIVKQKEKDATAFSNKENSFPVKEGGIAGLRNEAIKYTKKTGGPKKTNDEQRLKINRFFIAITSTNLDESENGFLKKTEYYPIEKASAFQLIEKSFSGNLITGLPANKKLFPLPVIDNANLKTNAPNIKKRRKGHSFIPYWTMVAYASYDRANYKLESDLPANVSSIKHQEVHEPSFSVSVLASRQLRKHWGLQTGLIYSNTAIGISPQKLYALQQSGGDIAFKYSTSSGYAYIKPGLGMPPAMGDSLNTTEGKHKLQFIRIPVMIKYTVGENKFTVSSGAGIEANFLASAKVETEIEHPVNPEIVFINKLHGAKPFHLTVVAGAELRYQVNKKLAVNLHPVFRYAITPITKNNVVQTFPYSFGLGFGMTRQF